MGCPPRRSGPPPPEWPDESTIRAQQDSYGTHSATAVLHEPGVSTPTPRELHRITSRADFCHWINGYDTGIRYCDDHIAQLLQALDDAGVRDETIIVVSADHGESQGEFNVYGDHQTADLSTCRVPWIIRGPGIEAGLNTGLHYHYDMTAGLLAHLGLTVPARWDSVPAGLQGGSSGRENLVVSQAAWSCQRSVVFGDHLLMRTYHPGLKNLPDTALFNWRQDPHQTTDLSRENRALVAAGNAYLARWLDHHLAQSPTGEDPMDGVIREGGPFHTRGRLEEYLRYYRANGRADIAESMRADHQAAEEEVT